MIATSGRNIPYISMPYAGSVHDFSMMKQEFDPMENWFENMNANVDLWFLDIESVYNFNPIKIPHKKPKNGSLTDEQKAENKMVGSERIFVEHSIGGLKRFRALADRLRTHSVNMRWNLEFLSR